jgi:hypothetical protein
VAGAVSLALVYPFEFATVRWAGCCLKARLGACAVHAAGKASTNPAHLLESPPFFPPHSMAADVGGDSSRQYGNSEHARGRFACEHSGSV